MTRQRAPKPWDEAYRRKGRLWGGDRLDHWTSGLIETGRVPLPTPRHRWLDLACGDGKGLVPLARRGLSAASSAARPAAARAPSAPADAPSSRGSPEPLRSPAALAGIDIVQHALRLARDRLHAADIAGGNAGAPLPLVRGDMRALPFAAGSFDIVRAVHAVGHLVRSERTRAWAEVRRVLRDEGRAVVAEFAVGDLRDGAGDEVEPGSFVRAPGILTHYYDEGSFRDELEEGGLRCLELRREAHPFKVRGETKERVRVVALAAPDVSPER